ncbi:hypothetical protein [Nocardia sputorum]|uniref:Uncharacterized protein n=1 Tax=Nocardia sputorum TaxID=2984338 RepID=A0ABM8CY10_9NOCA|nr:hypothetical protein [Nocardia sputorum]BDT99890.1 hypothetical protein IFM12276_29190 [Nocardia sputorum]
MPINFLSGLDLIAALDARNVEAHLADAVEGCTACATTSRPGPGCPAGLAAQIRVADSVPSTLTAIELVDRLLALRRSPAPEGSGM